MSQPDKNVIADVNQVQDAASDASQKKVSIGTILVKKGAFSRKLRFFKNSQTRFRDILKKIKDGEDVEDVKKLKEKFSEIILVFKLFKNLCYSSNWITLKKDDDKLFVPQIFD